MSAATATDMYRGRRAMDPFPWRKHLIHGGIFALIILAIKVTSYLCGTRFEGDSIFSPIFFLGIAAFVFGLVVLIRSFRGFWMVVTRRFNRKEVGLVVLPAAMAATAIAMPIPNFREGVAGEIRKKTSREEWIGMAKNLIAAPPAWLKSLDQRPDKEWLATTSPIDRLDISRPPHVLLEPDTVQFHWGSPLAERWGIAISAIPGKEPILPPNSTGLLAVHPEVWIFRLLD